MKNKLKQILTGLKYAIEITNSQGCSVKLNQKLDSHRFGELIEYNFAKYSGSSTHRYNVNPSVDKSASELEHFNFNEARFVLEDLLPLVIELVDAYEDYELIRIKELVVILNERELLDDAEVHDRKVEKDNWAFSYIVDTFKSINKNGIYLAPQRLYEIEEGKFHVHFKLKKVPSDNA